MSEDKRWEEFKESIHREIDELRRSIWAELEARRDTGWKTITLFVIVGCALLASIVSILLAIFGAH